MRKNETNNNNKKQDKGDLKMGKDIRNIFLKLAKKESWNSIDTKIRTKELNNKLSVYRYNEFKEKAKLLSTFETYYNGRHERINNNEIICPTCGKYTFSKAQLAIHRENTPTCVGEYREETKAWEMCENEGCGKLFKTHRDVEKHMAYRRNGEGNQYINNITEGGIDRRTRFGGGVPKGIYLCLMGE